ncbi:T9SS type A sorting domain-containing protein [Flavobacteriales bacterium]|nr:T9SS type A sorting domain-containing protein [Flavobacteriales bacterium]
MKKIFTLLLGITLSVSSYSSHLMGGQITATYLSSDSTGSHYVLDLEVYRDMLGIQMSLNQTVEVYLLDTTVFPPTYSLSFIHTIAFDTTTGGAMSSLSSVYGVEIYNFRDTITFPANGNYIIKWSDFARNHAIINMSNPGGEYMSFLTFVSVDSNNPNSTPTFLTPPVAYLPVDSIWQYNPLPFDPDGDSIAWSISVPLGGGSPVPVDVVGYGSLSDTLYSNTNGIFSIDAITGQISWNPKMVGNFVASFAIAEYRNGVLIGGMSRDMQFVVVPDTLNAMPQISNMQSLPTNNMGYPYIQIAPGQNYQVSLLASDSDVNDVVSLEAFGESFGLITSPSLFSYTSTGNGNEVEGTFSWTPDMTHVRPNPYLVVFRTSDNFFYYDETVQVEVSLASDINEHSSFNLMDIYPNPAIDKFTMQFSLDKSQEISLDIYNVLGEKVTSEKLYLYLGNHILVNNFDLRSGQYFVTLADKNGVIINSQKLLVLK